MTKNTKIILIRHAESVHNVMKRTDPAPRPTYKYGLTPKGILQARAAGLALQEQIGDARALFIVSDYNRTRQTAAGLLEAFGSCENIDIALEPTLRERHRKDGNTPENPLDDQSFFYKETDNGGLGESAAELYDRVSGFWDNLTLRAEAGMLPQVVVLVTHSYVIRALLTHIYGVGRAGFDNAGLVGNCESVVMERVAPGIYDSESPFAQQFKNQRAQLRAELGIAPKSIPAMEMAS